MPIGQGGASVTVTADRASLLQLRYQTSGAADGSDGAGKWRLTAVEGTKNLTAGSLTLTFGTLDLMATGTYSYEIGGVEPRMAVDTVTVSQGSGGVTTVAIGLPDMEDDTAYDLQGEMLVGAPVTVVVPMRTASSRPAVPPAPPSSPSPQHLPLPPPFLPPDTSPPPTPPTAPSVSPPPSPPAPPPAACLGSSVPADEIFARYFDVAAGSAPGTFVSGRLNPYAPSAHPLSPPFMITPVDADSTQYCLYHIAGGPTKTGAQSR